MSFHTNFIGQIVIFSIVSFERFDDVGTSDVVTSFHFLVGGGGWFAHGSIDGLGHCFGHFGGFGLLGGEVGGGGTFLDLVGFFLGGFWFFGGAGGGGFGGGEVGCAGYRAGEEVRRKSSWEGGGGYYGGAAGGPSLDVEEAIHLFRIVVLTVLELPLNTNFNISR